MKMRNIVLMGLMALLASAFVAYGVPSFTPIVDGNQDAGWGFVPDHSTNTSKIPTSFNLVGGCFMTDDSADVYIGIPTDADPGAAGCAMHVLIDIKKTAAGANTDAYGACGVAYDMPYLPEYSISSEWTTGAISYANKCTWGGSSWTGYDPIHGTGAIAGGANLFTEIRLPRNEYDGLALDDTIHISVWLRPEHVYNGGSDNANACLPADADFPTDDGTAPCAPGPDYYFSTQFEYVIQTALVDNTPPQVVSVEQAGSDGVIVNFDEFMDETTLVFGNFTIDGGLSFTASEVLSGMSVLLTADANFVNATLYTVTANSNVKDVGQNSVDPLHDSGSFTAVAYALVTFVYVDQNADLTAPHCKGSFNNYGNYDPSWGVTPFPMFDDGTNGDVTPGDNEWAAQFYLKPTATDTFGWGVTEGLGGEWAMECGDLKFTVLDASPQTQSYTVGLYAPVTFRIDDSAEGTLTECWLKGTFNSIGRYEGAWSDFLQMYDDGAHNDLDPGDNIWGLTVNIVPDDYCHDSTWEWGAADAYDGNWLINGPNRQFAVPTSDPRIETYTIVPMTVQAVTVTFNVDMQYLLAIPLNIDSMAIAGGFNGWDADSMIMADPEPDSIYTVDVVFDSGSVKYHEFKFVRWDAAAADWESISNRILNIDDSGPTQTIDCIWNDWIPAPNPPDSLTISLYDTEIDGGVLPGIMLRWTPPEEGDAEVTGYYIYRDTTGTVQPMGPPVGAVPVVTAGPISATMFWKSGPPLGGGPYPVESYEVNATTEQPFQPQADHTVTFNNPPPLASLTVNRGDWVCFDNVGNMDIAGVFWPTSQTSPWECGNTDFSLPANPTFNVTTCWRIDPNAALGPYTYRIDYNTVTGGQLTITVQ